MVRIDVPLRTQVYFLVARIYLIQLVHKISRSHRRSPGEVKDKG